MGWDVCMARGHRGLLRASDRAWGGVTVHYALSPCLFSLGTFQSVQQQVDRWLHTLHGQAPCVQAELLGFEVSLWGFPTPGDFRPHS